MQNPLNQTTSAVVDYVPSLLGALGVLILGTLVALIIASVVKKALSRTSWDDRIASSIGGTDGDWKSEEYLGKAVFWLLMVFVFIGALQVIGLTPVTEPLSAFLNEVVAFLPNLFGALVLVVLAWILARAARWLIVQALRRTGVDERFGEPATETTTTEPSAATRRSISGSLGEAVYWLVLLLFLPAILGVLQLGGLLEPVRNMLDTFLVFVPNLLAAALILAVGWFVARIVRRLVTNLLVAVGADRLSERIGLSRVLGDLNLSGLVGLVLQVLILVPVIVASLDALQLEAVTQPMSAMLDSILLALPDIFAALVLLAIAYAIARVVADLTTSLLAGIGVDRLPARFGVTTEPQTPPEGARKGGWRLSRIGGAIVFAGIMLFATLEALQLLQFASLAALMAAFLVFAARVLLALVIFAFGFWLANLAGSAIRRSDLGQSGVVAFAAKAAILVLAGAIALRELGVANEIINLGFAFLLGAIAVAVALAFGLGAREPAGRLAAEWIDSFQEGRGGSSRLSTQPSGD